MREQGGSPAGPVESRPKRRRKWFWIGLLVGAVLLVLIVRGRVRAAPKQSSSKTGGTGPVTILTSVAKQGDIGVYLDAIGTVTPMYTDMITSQVTGQISEVHYKEGQIVKTGDPLIDIDVRPYQAQLVQAQGALERDTNVLEQAAHSSSKSKTSPRRRTPSKPC